MVIVVDRPAIEYVVREAVLEGIEQIILVTHSSKASLENYFDLYSSATFYEDANVPLLNETMYWYVKHTYGYSKLIVEQLFEKRQCQIRVSPCLITLFYSRWVPIKLVKSARDSK